MAKLYFKVEADYEKVIKLREECKKLEEQLKNMDSASSPASVRKLEKQLSEARSEMSGLTSEAARAGAQMEHGFKTKIYEASKAVNSLSDKIIAQRAVVRKAGDEAKRLGEAYREALKSKPSEADGLLERYKVARASLQGEKDALFGLTQEQAKARLSVKKLRDEYKLYEKGSDSIKAKNDEVKNSFDGMSFSLGKAIGIIGGTAALKKLGEEIVRVRGEFQEMETSIETMVGKNMAGKLIPQIKELAKISPLTMSDMVGAEKMMLGFNIAAEDTIKYLKAMSDLSMGSGTKFNSLTLAFSQMSAAGKLMGQDLNQMINAGFNPLQQIAQRTGKSIAQLKEEMSKGAVSAQMVQQAFIDATSEGGKFFKMSENASKTINGQISMMEDATDAMFNEIGKASEGFIVNAISTTTSLIENYETIGKVLVGLIATYGAYKTALLAVMAVEKAHAVQRLASIKGISAMSAATGLLTKKLGILNFVMKMNPYAAVASVLAALTATVWGLEYSTSAAEKTQNRFNKALEEQKEKENEHKKYIEALQSAIENGIQTEGERIKAFEKLKAAYPSIFNDYITERDYLKDILKYKRLIAEEDSRKSEGDAREQLRLEEQKLRHFINRQKQGINLVDLNGNGWAETNVADAIKAQQDVVNKAKANLSSFAETKFLKSVKELKDEQLVSVLDDMTKSLEMLGDSGNDAIAIVTSLGGEFSREQIERMQSALKTEQNSRKNKNTYKDDYEKAEREWKEAKTKLEEIQKDKEKFTSKQYEDQQKLVKSKEAAFKALGGDVSGKESKKAEKEAKALARSNERMLNAQRKSQADEIALMEEGREKKLAQIRLEYQSREDEIKRLEDQQSKSNKEAGEKAVNANGLTDDQQAETDRARKLNNEKRIRAELDVFKAEKEAMNQYLMEYGSMQQQKLAIAESYAARIAKASTEGEKLSLEEERKVKISEVDAKSIFDSIDWSIAFGELGGMFSDVIEPVLSQLRQFVGTDKFKGMDAASQKTIIEALNQMESSVVSTSSSLKDFAPLVERFKESVAEASVAEGTQRLAYANLEKAQARYTEAMAHGTEAEKASAKAGLHLAETNAKAADETLEAARENAKESKEAVKRMATDLKAGMDSINNGLSMLSSGSLRGIWDGVEKASQGLGKLFAGKMGNAFGKLAEKMEKFPIVGWVLSILDVFKDGITDVLTGIIDTIFSALNNIVKDVISLDALKGVFNSLVSGVGEFWNTLTFGAFHKDGNAKEVRQTIENLTERNKALIQSIDDLRDTMEKESGYRAVDAYTKAVKYQEEVNKNLLEIAKAQGGYHKSHQSWNHYFDFGKDDIRWIQQNIKKDFFGDDDLWTLSPEQMKMLRENVELWQRMTEGGKGDYGQRVIDKLNDYIDQAGKIDELTNKVNESITGISFDAFKDGFVDALFDMEKSADDFARDFERKLQNSIFRAMVDDEFSEDIKELYEKWYQAAKDGMENTEAENLRAEQKKLIDELLKRRDELNKEFGWDKDNPYKQEASSKGFDAMSQETGDELNGRFTAMYESELRRENIQNEQLTVLRSMASGMSASTPITDISGPVDKLLDNETKMYTIADDTRTILANSYVELQQIRENTGAIVKPIKQIQADIAEVKRNTERL